MTATESTNANISTYDQLRTADFIPVDIKEQWTRFEQRKQRYQDALVRLLRDEDLTPEAKARRASELEASEKPRIEKEAKELKAALLKSAESAERASIPTFHGETLNPSDPTKVLISQNEAARIMRRIERAQNSKGPFKPAVEDILKAEYEKALEMADTRGGAIIRGCLMVAEELGMDTGWVPRQDRHREALDRARQRLFAANSIPTRSSAAPSLPRSLQPPRKLSKRPERRRDSAPMLMPKAEPVVVAENQSATAGTPGKRAAQKSQASRRKKPWK